MARGGRPSTEEAAQTSYHRRSGPHSERPLRPELTGEWNIPVAWEPQPAFKAHCVPVALSAFDLSLVPLPLLWGLIILGLLGEHGKFLIPISTRTIGAWDLLGWTVNCSWTHKEFSWTAVLTERD